LAAWPRGVGSLERPMPEDAIRYLSLSFSEHPPISILNHSGPVNGALYSPDGTRILSWSDDKTLRLWDAATGTSIGANRARPRRDPPAAAVRRSPSPSSRPKAEACCHRTTIGSASRPASRPPPRPSRRAAAARRSPTPLRCPKASESCR
jgi:hypothetical protein